MDLNQPRQVHHAAYSRVQPKATASPRLLAHSPEVLADLGLDPQTAETDEFARCSPGTPPRCDGPTHGLRRPPVRALGRPARRRTGHRLGKSSQNGARHMLQLKGAGPPYSCRADGLVLRSSVREFLCSEAMHHLGVPTRALSLTTTGDQVMRDMFYDGHPEWGPVRWCARRSVIHRLARSNSDVARDNELLRALADHTISLFPEIADGRRRLRRR